MIDMKYKEQFNQLILQSVVVFVVILCFLIIWAYWAPLQSASLASGNIRVEGKRQSLKSVYSGIVKEIHAEEGDYVESGDLLVSLDSREDEIHLKRLLSELAQLHISLARLNSYADNRTEIEYSDKVLLLIEKMKLKDLMRSSDLLHRQQMDLLDNKYEMMALRKNSKQADIEGKKRTRESLQKQIIMTEKERQSAQALVDKQYLSENQLINFDRNMEQLNNRLSEVDTENFMAGHSLQELRVGQLQYEYSERFASLAEIYRLQARQPIVESQINLLRLRIARSSLKSPVSGRVVNRRINTVGSSVASGQLLLELVPADDRLVLDVRLDPKDIEHVYPGSQAKVRFMAYSPRQYPALAAVVETVAADVSLDENGGSYYSVTLLPSSSFSGMNSALDLYPGMPAEATILTGKRTLLDYLLSPLINLRDKSMRER